MSQRSRTDLCGGCRATGIPTATYFSIFPIFLSANLLMEQVCSGRRSVAELDPHRESCRRQHRVLGNYLAMEAWSRGIDCIVLVRPDLEKFLGLKRFKSARIKWLRSDLKPWFPHQDAFYKTTAPSSISSLYLSRLSLSGHLPKGSMTTDKRIARMGSDAPTTEYFSKPGATLHTEAEIIAYLATLAAGLEIPRRRGRRRKKR